MLKSARACRFFSREVFFLEWSVDDPTGAYLAEGPEPAKAVSASVPHTQWSIIQPQ
jgi:hypothetical protein